ncbi:C45 family autoproteolytic acyltransferase/hydolase [Salisediminibacterium selenitireducens]|uniref:Peptidase C45 acyl-coenzyme A:6-aminopenicillanic acid acyl-transferase n=1 Tax=Bacillus selenitireducens (strain ATCC 700615 / DSM 15326 / MLS10) TaxID=439292 RepID=D6XUJ4_BACIE|nr:C45 family peptidase [Salisediminibacterium selenitireducens]ADH99480.1 peptidase C45 acyl-coenzyme A:6-aminopenicillanic acid acyl-transferase [[Bacillus] selenitireducens MLS10]
MQISVDVLESRADPYTFGFNQGIRLQSMPVFNKHRKRCKKSIRSYTTDLQEYTDWIKQIKPDLLDELRGLSDAIGWKTEDVIHEYGGFQSSWVKSGCSAMMPPGQYVRNYDYHPKTYDGRFVLYQPNSGYAHIGFAQRVIGRMDGMNSEGLGVGYHFVNRLRPEKGFICTTVTRLILETCKDVDEATALLSSLPHRFAFNYSLADASGRSVVIETSSKGVHVHDETLRICSNHFFSVEKEHENRNFLTETKERYEKLQQQYQEDLSPLQAFTRINHLDFGIAKTDYKNSAGTIHSAVYDLRHLKVYAGIGTDAKPVVINFKQWLSGTPVYYSKLKGVIPEIEGAEHLEVQT